VGWSMKRWIKGSEMKAETHIKETFKTTTQRKEAEKVIIRDDIQGPGKGRGKLSKKKVCGNNSSRSLAAFFPSLLWLSL
jgi:hypothetical protein